MNPPRSLAISHSLNAAVPAKAYVFRLAVLIYETLIRKQ